MSEECVVEISKTGTGRRRRRRTLDVVRGEVAFASVEAAPAIFVAQDLVGVTDPREDLRALTLLLFTRLLVWMVLQRKLAVRRLDLRSGGVARDFEHVIGVVTHDLEI